MKTNLFKSLTLAIGMLTSVTSATAEEITATLVHTAGTAYSLAVSSGKQVNTVDGENEYYNKDDRSGWVGYAFAEFSFTIPEGETISKAELTWTANSPRKYDGNIYYLNTGASLDYNKILSTQENYRFNGNKTWISKDNFKGIKTITTDVTDALNAISEAGQKYIIFQWTGNNGSATLSGKASDKAPVLKITTVSASSTTKYTIKYVDASGKDIKEAKEYDGIIGQNITATADDIETFYSSDASEKYVYKSGNNEIKLAEDEASNVITLTFSKYTKFGYTINAKENSTDLGEVAKGETYSDGADIAISKFYKINNEWYETTTSPYYINIKPENKAATIEVKKSDITYFAETEKLGNNIGASYNKNMSNGAYSAIAGSKTAELCELPAGEYKVTIYLYERGDRGAYIRDLNNADLSTNTLCYADINKNSSNLKEYSVTLKLYKTTKIGLSGWTTHNEKNDTYSTNQSAGLDYIYIQRTGDATETVSVSDAGYATYATTNNIEVPESNDVKVMTVKVNEDKSTITLHEVKAGTVIPAYTGILVKAAKGDYNFVVTSDKGETLANNDLKAAKEAVTSDGATFFALTKMDTKVGFALVANDVVIPAGKAYLEVSKGTAAKFFSLDGEATGINSVKTAKADGAYYTLEGVKTTKPVKGLYIHNGKKIVVK